MMKQHFYEMNNSGGSGNGSGPGPALGNLKSMVLAASAAQIMQINESGAAGVLNNNHIKNSYSGSNQGIGGGGGNKKPSPLKLKVVLPPQTVKNSQLRNYKQAVLTMSGGSGGGSLGGLGPLPLQTTAQVVHKVNSSASLKQGTLSNCFNNT